jgi:TatA/E family protein of Tat protein translocase
MPFNIGPMELIVVLIIALIVIGPGKLPDVGSALGKSIREFRKASTDVKEATSLEPVKAPEAQAAVAAAPVPEAVAAPVPAPIPPALAAVPAAAAVAAPVEASAAAPVAPPVAASVEAPAAIATGTDAAPESGPLPGTADAGVWPAELVPAAEDVAEAVADETVAPSA